MDRHKWAAQVCCSGLELKQHIPQFVGRVLHVDDKPVLSGQKLVIWSNPEQAYGRLYPVNLVLLTSMVVRSIPETWDSISATSLLQCFGHKYGAFSGHRQLNTTSTQEASRCLVEILLCPTGCWQMKLNCSTANNGRLLRFSAKAITPDLGPLAGMQADKLKLCRKRTHTVHEFATNHAEEYRTAPKRCFFRRA